MAIQMQFQLTFIGVDPLVKWSAIIVAKPAAETKSVPRVNRIQLVNENKFPLAVSVRITFKIHNSNKWIVFQ